MSSVEKIYFSPAPPFNDLPKDQPLENKRGGEREKEVLLSFPWKITGDTGRNTSDHDCPKEAKVFFLISQIRRAIENTRKTREQKGTAEKKKRESFCNRKKKGEQSS